MAPPPGTQRVDELPRGLAEQIDRQEGAARRPEGPAAPLKRTQRMYVKRRSKRSWKSTRKSMMKSVLALLSRICEKGLVTGNRSRPF